MSRQDSLIVKGNTQCKTLGVGFGCDEGLKGSLRPGNGLTSFVRWKDPSLSPLQPTAAP